MGGGSSEIGDFIQRSILYMSRGKGRESVSYAS